MIINHNYWGHLPICPDFTWDDDPPPIRGPVHGPREPITYPPYGPFRPRIPVRYPGRFPSPRYPYPSQWENSTTDGEEQIAYRPNPREEKQVINDIIKAINGEYSAVICYGELAKKAPNEVERSRILEIRHDEERHLKKFRQVYYNLTGRKVKPEQTESCPTTYQAGIRAAFIDEQETVDFYNEIADKAKNVSVKQIFRRAALDEQNHAVWFLYFLSR